MKPCPLALSPLIEHDFSTVVESLYTIPDSSGQPLERTDVRVVCRKCGAVTDDPFHPIIVYKLKEGSGEVA